MNFRIIIFATLTILRPLEHVLRLSGRVVSLHLHSFKRCKNTLKTSLFPKIPTSLSKGNRYLSVIHCRIRNGCSNLNNDLFGKHINVLPLCSCGNGNETADHIFFECPLFNDQRIIFFRRTRCYHPLSLHALLSGKDNLSAADNDKLFIEVQNYIKNSGRFR